MDQLLITIRVIGQFGRGAADADIGRAFEFNRRTRRGRDFAQHDFAARMIDKPE